MVDEINKIKEYAKDKNIPIMQDEGIDYLLNYIKENKIKNILEIGSAIGYSAIMMASINKDIKVTTIEKDYNRYIEAINNIDKVGLKSQINIINLDALDYETNDIYDLIFIDAAKSKNKVFFEKFSLNLKDKGTIMTDNMNFHGLVYEENIKNRNLRQLVRKIKNYKEFLKEKKEFKTKFLDIGDGVAISIKEG